MIKQILTGPEKQFTLSWDKCFLLKKILDCSIKWLLNGKFQIVDYIINQTLLHDDPNNQTT